MDAKSFWSWLREGPLKKQGASETYRMVLAKIGHQIIPFTKRDRNRYIVDRDIAAVRWLSAHNLKNRVIGNLSWRDLGLVFEDANSKISDKSIKQLLSQGNDYHTISSQLEEEILPHITKRGFKVR